MLIINTLALPIPLKCSEMIHFSYGPDTRIGKNRNINIHFQFFSFIHSIRRNAHVMTLKKATILAIDDDTDVLTAVRLLLKSEVKEIITDKNPENIPSLLSKHTFDLILLDMNFNASINTGNEGIYWLKRIKELKPDVLVIMITAYGDIDLAVRSLKEGASDFVVKPWHNEKLQR
jgi:response regulator RpfG family c-di-GMP phosphodiesterase